MQVTWPLLSVLIWLPILGGLVTLAIARQFPGRFGRLLVMSPSVWWDDRVILKRLRRVGFHPRPRVWLDIGRRDDYEEALVHWAQRADANRDIVVET